MSLLTLSPEVQTAQSERQPLVALESTIITHGMPWPENLKMAQDVEQCIRDSGAIPATIAVLDGRLCIGLTDAQLTGLAQTREAAKLSRADLAACMAMGGTGATTVAATMIGAAHAGISVFATGGIGGVHRGAEHSFDISADLHELAQTPVTVVAAGAKAILDLPKTLEVLETLGVPVIAYGQDSLPAFWSAQSELPAPLRMDTSAQIAGPISCANNWTCQAASWSLTLCRKPKRSARARWHLLSKPPWRTRRGKESSAKRSHHFFYSGFLT